MNHTANVIVFNSHIHEKLQNATHHLQHTHTKKVTDIPNHLRNASTTTQQQSNPRISTNNGQKQRSHRANTQLPKKKAPHKNMYHYRTKCGKRDVEWKLRERPTYLTDSRAKTELQWGGEDGLKAERESVGFCKEYAIFAKAATSRSLCFHFTEPKQGRRDGALMSPTSRFVVTTTK